MDADLADPLVLFVLMIAYTGAAGAVSTYLVDMSPKGPAVGLCAVSNTVIGGCLLIAGWRGWRLSVYMIGPVATPGFIQRSCSAAAAFCGACLREVEGRIDRPGPRAYDWGAILTPRGGKSMSNTTATLS